MRNKKAQITIFIIAGILLIIGAALFLTIRREAVKEDITTSLELITEEVPVEFKPVSNFIEDALRKTSEEGITKLGQKGGFIKLVENDIITTADPTNSDAAQFPPGAELSIPYWSHLKSENTCKENCQFEVIPIGEISEFDIIGTKLSLRKPGASIESELETYIEENLRTWLSNFQELREEGFIISEEGPIEATITVAENEVIAQINYPLEIEKTSKAEISKFFIRLPVNLKKIYELGLLITNFQTRFNFLEKQVLNHIVAFSGVDDDELPPMSDTKFRVGNVITWKKSKVEEMVKGMLDSSMRMFQVVGTRNYEQRRFPNSPLKESLYNSGMSLPGSADYSDLEVSFEYVPWWDFYFDLNCNGETCKPESIMSDIVALIGIQSYNFIYDISWPVKVTITDPYAFNMRGYAFQFLLEGNIRQNDPMTANFYVTPGASIERTMLCDDNKRTSGEITIEAKDQINNLGIEDVQIAFSSYEESCLIGSTDEDGIFKGSFPVAMGGSFTLIKEGYLKESKRIEPRIGKTKKYTLFLKPKQTKKFTVMKKVMLKQGSVWSTPTNQEIPLREGEEATVTLTKISSFGEEQFTAYGFYLANQAESSEMQISPGRYQLDISLIYDQPIIIPEQTIEEDGEEYTIESFTLEEGFQVGGLSLNYTIRKSDLEKDEIVFYVINPDIAAVPESQRTYEDINQLSNIEQLSKKYRGILVPKFK